MVSVLNRKNIKSFYI